MTDKSGRNTSSETVAARQHSTQESAQRPRTASLRRHLRSITHPVRGLAAFRIWVRRSEIAIVALAILAGGASGLIASLMGGATRWLHLMLFGPGAEFGLSAMTECHSACRLPHTDRRRPATRSPEPRPGAVVAAAPHRSHRGQRALRRPPVAGRRRRGRGAEHRLERLRCFGRSGGSLRAGGRRSRIPAGRSLRSAPSRPAGPSRLRRGGRHRGRVRRPGHGRLLRLRTHYRQLHDRELSARHG